MKYFQYIALAATTALLLSASLAVAQEPTDARRDGGGPGASAQSFGASNKKRQTLTDEEKADLEALRVQMIQDGIDYLKESQSANGSFSASPRVGIGPTLIDAIGLLRVGVKLD